MMHKGEEPRRFSVELAYFGETLTHPGVTVGGEYRVLRRRWFVFFTEATLGYYLHIRNHHGLFAEVGLGGRFVTKPGFFGELRGGVGYLHTWLEGDVYTVHGGALEEVTDQGRSHLMVHGALGIGWDYQKKRSVPVSWFIRSGCFGQYPYNGYMLPHFFAQVGVAYRFE